jgi:branched-chain amino acid transport system ATP-binding protein
MLIRKSSARFKESNEDLSKLSPLVRIKKGIALVPQGRSVFPDLNVLENMEMGAYTVRDKNYVRGAHCDFIKVLD